MTWIGPCVFHKFKPNVRIQKLAGKARSVANLLTGTGIMHQEAHRIE